MEKVDHLDSLCLQPLTQKQIFFFPQKNGAWKKHQCELSNIVSANEGYLNIRHNSYLKEITKSF